MVLCNDVLKDLTIIIPSRNEADSLRVLVPIINSSSSRVFEILIIVDSTEDTSFQAEHDLKVIFKNCRFLVSKTGGVSNAITTGVENANSDKIMILVADEVLIPLVIDKFCNNLEIKNTFVSATRYSGGGRRYGGSLLSHIFSRTFNWLLRPFCNGLTDLTTGIKGFRKEDWNRINQNINFGGWSCSLALTLNAIKARMVVVEIPIISIDRITGGSSSFEFFLWVAEYLKVLRCNIRVLKIRI
jgi:glycosyltransferase involved in cell wall biosynthesis